MGTALTIDKLAGDAYAVASLANTSLKYVAYAEFTPDFLDVDGLSLVGERGVSRDNEQRLEPRQRRNDVLDDAVREVFLRGGLENLDIRLSGVSA